MNQFTNSIDVSKLTLEVYDHIYQKSYQVANTTADFKDLIRQSRKINKDLGGVLFCFEHTGMYSLPLAIYLSEQNQSYCLIAGLEIKRSLGLKRGKSDKADAQAIAKYAFLRREELEVYKLPSENLLDLKSLLSLRKGW